MAVRYIFTAVPNKTLEKIIESDFTKRQLKILMQVFRITFGCKSFFAVVQYSDFKWAGIGRNVIKNELLALRDLNIIRFDTELGLISMNPRIEEWNVPPSNTSDMSEIRSRVLSKQLKGTPILRILELKPAEEIRLDEALKETVKKLNTGILTKHAIQDKAVAFGRYKASVRTLAEEKKVEHDDDNYSMQS